VLCRAKPICRQQHQRVPESDKVRKIDLPTSDELAETSCVGDTGEGGDAPSHLLPRHSHDSSYLLVASCGYWRFGGWFSTVVATLPGPSSLCPLHPLQLLPLNN